MAPSPILALRAKQELLDLLDAEARELSLSRTEYVRMIIGRRGNVGGVWMTVDKRGVGTPHGSEVDALRAAISGGNLSVVFVQHGEAPGDALAATGSVI